MNEIIETNIILKDRLYNGDFGKGSIFGINTYINLKQENNSDKSALGVIKLELNFCINEELGANINSVITNEIPMIISNDNKLKLNNIIKEIENNSDYKYNESHYKKDRFDPERLKYKDVIINNEEFEIKSDDNNINELLSIFNYHEYLNIQMNNYRMIIGKEN